MARHFNSVSLQYLNAGPPAVTTTPLTIAGWVKMITGLGSDAAWALGKDGTNYWSVSLSSSVARSLTWDGTTWGIANFPSQPSLDVWHHMAVIFTSATSRVSYLDGVAGVVSTVNSAPLAATNFDIGRVTGGGQYLLGDIAEVGIWNMALSSADVQKLAASKYAPSLVQSGNLKHYYPLFAGDDTDHKGTLDLTAVNNPTDVAHPAGIVYGLGRHIGFVDRVVKKAIGVSKVYSFNGSAG